MEESITLLEQICSSFQCKDTDIRTYSPLTLAYIGDAVYELVIRSVVVRRGNRPVNHLHRMTTQFVKAGTQAAMLEALTDMLTEEERDICRRGRNANPNTRAKNATLREYHKATGMEALMGYLYLTGRTDRMIELVREGISRIGMKL